MTLVATPADQSNCCGFGVTVQRNEMGISFYRCDKCEKECSLRAPSVREQMDLKIATLRAVADKLKELRKYDLYKMRTDAIRALWDAADMLEYSRQQVESMFYRMRDAEGREARLHRDLISAIANQGRIAEEAERLANSAAENCGI